MATVECLLKGFQPGLLQTSKTGDAIFIQMNVMRRNEDAMKTAAGIHTNQFMALRGDTC